MMTDTDTDTLTIPEEILELSDERRIRIANNLKPFVLSLKIITKDNRFVELADVINYAQEDLLDTVCDNIRAGVPTRIIVLKARQIGISTIIEAMMFAFAFIVKHMRGKVVSHENDSAQHLLSMTVNYWDTWWGNGAYTAKWASQTRMKWAETGSQINIATAKTTAAGRSQTLQFLHASEVAFWDKPSVLMGGLAQSVPSIPMSFIFMESTANGIGNYFQQQWDMAAAGQTNYIPKFYPWWRHPEYTAEAINMADARLGDLDDAEQQVVKFLRSQGLDDAEVRSRLIWRRYAIKDLCQNSLDTFHQEYPSYPEEAFISTGRNVFNLQKLDAVYDPSVPKNRGKLVERAGEYHFTPDDNGPLEIYRHPESSLRGQYVVFGDPTRTTEGDFAVIQVLSRWNWEQVAVWRDKIDSVKFGDKMFELGWYYNRAIVSCETNGPGHASISNLLKRNYPHVWENQNARRFPNYTGMQYGWASTYATKQEAIGTLQSVVMDGNLLLHHTTTYLEMKSYVTENMGFGNSDESSFDDCVTSLAGAVITASYEWQTVKTEYDDVRSAPTQHYKPIAAPGEPARDLDGDKVTESWSTVPPWMLDDDSAADFGGGIA